MRKSRYGADTTPDCFFCDSKAIIRNKLGLEVCRECKDKTEMLCPLCGDPMEVRNGKYGTFLFCWKCNRNWSKYNLRKYRKYGGFKT